MCEYKRITIPDSKVYQESELIKGTEHEVYYYIPWIDKWIFSRSMSKVLKSIGESPQSYYDRFFLNILDVKDRPKCTNCGEELEFNKISRGYSHHELGTQENIFCSRSCNASYYSRIGRIGMDGYSETGWYISNKSGKVKYESSWEREYCEVLDKIPEVLKYSTQSLEIEYDLTDGSKRRYRVDFIVTYVDGHNEIIEIKPKRKVDDEIVQLKAKAASKYCRDNNLNYRIITEVELGELIATYIK